jgi:DNA-binding transcriptional regulator YiaG
MKIDIKKEREKLLLTQEAFAKLVGVHPRTVQKWELGEIQQLRVSTLARIRATILTLSLCEEKT